MSAPRHQRAAEASLGPASAAANAAVSCMWTVDDGDLVVTCGATGKKLLIVLGGGEAIALCAAHAAEISRLPNVAPADDETLVMRWA